MLAPAVGWSADTVADDPKAQAVWASYAGRWAQTDDYSASFRQTIEVASTGGTVESSGLFYFAKPDRMLWRYMEGPPQTVVGDGQWIWVYQPDLEQVYKLDYEEAFGSGGLIGLLDGREGLGKRYRISFAEADGGLVALHLAPRDPAGETVDLTLKADSFDLVSVVLTDSSGSITRIAFSDTERNHGLDPSLFSFTPPDGVDIITHQ